MTTKTVVVFCAFHKNVSITKQVVKNLYGNSPVNILYTGLSARNINGKIDLPITAQNRPNFNRQLSEFLGNRKVDLFVFEHCPIMMMYFGRNGFNSTPFNRRILNVISKYGKNNFRVATPWKPPSTNLPTPSPRLVLNRGHNISPYWKTYKFRPNNNWVLV